MPRERIIYILQGASRVSLTANPAIAPWLTSNSSVSLYRTKQNSVTPLHGAWIMVSTDAPMHANLYALPECVLIYGISVEDSAVTSIYKNTLDDLSDLKIICNGLGAIASPGEPAYAA
jgi:hypothetical protein